jgi:hypothetical protein
LGILSFELYTHRRKLATLRVHHTPNTPQEFRQRLAQIPGAQLSPRVGINFEGDLLQAARSISEEVARWRGRCAK